MNIKAERISPARAAIDGLPAPPFEIIIQKDHPDGNEESMGLSLDEAKELVQDLKRCIVEALDEKRIIELLYE